MAVPSVVFVCGRNAVRSPMAEGFWKARFGSDCLARSCGVEPAAWPDGFMINVMGESGVDLSNFECRDLADTADDPVELVVCLAQDADPAASAFAAGLAAAKTGMLDPDAQRWARRCAQALPWLILVGLPLNLAYGLVANGPGLG